MYDERNSPNISQDAVDDCEVENYPSASPVGGITESKNLEDDPPQWECIKTFLDEPLDETEYVNVQNKASIGIGLSVQEIARKFYSTTSSVYAEHTISNPNTEQILFCISTVLQAQIFEDVSAPLDRKACHLEFNHPPLQPSDSGEGVETIPDDVLYRESENDDELRKLLIAGSVPTVEIIYKYLTLLKEHARYPSECNIIAIIYTNRITSMGSMPLTVYNWRAIWVVSVIIAQKMWDDKPLKTSSFAHILPSFTKHLLRNLELKALNLIQFSSGVKPSLYAQYYFELRTLFSEIKGNTFATSTEWTLKPLSIIKARRLEDRSMNVWDIQKTKSGTGLSSSKMSPITAQGRDSRNRFTSAAAPSFLSQNKGWQTFSPAQAHAHERLQMMELHEESKGKNINPYVFDRRSRPSSSASSRLDASGSTCSSPLTSSSPVTSCGGKSASDLTLSHVPSSSEFTIGWVCSDVQRGEEQVVRTFEDVTLTDISRFVLS